MGLAFASALVVLIASGVAVSRLGSDDGPRRSAETAAPARAPEPATPGSAAAGPEAAAPSADVAGAGRAVSSASAPVPPPVPARSAVRRSVATPAGTPTGSPTATTTGGTGSGGSGSAGSAMQGSGADGSESTPPSNQGEPDSSALLAASVSVGEGPSGAVVGAGVGDSPETDVTVGDTKVVGDAPPSDGTAVDLGGRFIHPPPTIPTPPG